MKTINSEQTIVNGVAVTKAIIGFVVQSNNNNKKSTVKVCSEFSSCPNFLPVTLKTKDNVH